MCERTVFEGSKREECGSSEGICGSDSELYGTGSRSNSVFGFRSLRSGRLNLEAVGKPTAFILYRREKR
jgi:hypothetical protein